MSEENSKQNEAKPVKKKRPSKKPGQKKKRREAAKLTPQQLITNDFAACGRCSYLWAGYRVIVGEDGIETAVNTVASGWMRFNWNQEVRHLVHKTYGVRVDNDFYHYEGCCKECQRPYVYDQPLAEGEAATFQVELLRVT